MLDSFWEIMLGFTMILWLTIMLLFQLVAELLGGLTAKHWNHVCACVSSRGGLLHGVWVAVEVSESFQLSNSTQCSTSCCLACRCWSSDAIACKQSQQLGLLSCSPLGFSILP